MDGSGAGGFPWFASSADTHVLPRPAKPVHLKQPVSIQFNQQSFCQVFPADAHETSAYLVFYMKQATEKEKEKAAAKEKREQQTAEKEKEKAAAKEK